MSALGIILVSAAVAVYVLRIIDRVRRAQIDDWDDEDDE